MFCHDIFICSPCIVSRWWSPCYDSRVLAGGDVTSNYWESTPLQETRLSEGDVSILLRNINVMLMTFLRGLYITDNLLIDFQPIHLYPFNIFRNDIRMVKCVWRYILNYFCRYKLSRWYLIVRSKGIIENRGYHSITKQIIMCIPKCIILSTNQHNYYRNCQALHYYTKP